MYHNFRKLIWEIVERKDYGLLDKITLGKRNKIIISMQNCLILLCLYNVLSMKFPVYEMSCLWNGLFMKCPAHEMSCLWNVLSMKCLSKKCLSMKCLSMKCLSMKCLSMKCPVHEMSYLWNVSLYVILGNVPTLKIKW